MLEKKFEMPRKIGERRRIRVEVMMRGRASLEANPGRRNFTRAGAKIPTTTLVTTTAMKNAEKTLSMNFLPLSASFSVLSMKNGIRTEAETTEAMETKIRSGIRKAA
jgi:ribosomal protein L39E